VPERRETEDLRSAAVDYWRTTTRTSGASRPALSRTRL